MPSSKQAFSYEHRVQFYETDLMGIVHHGNYLRFYEEARVAWAIHRGLINYQQKESASRLAVLETNVKHLKPLFFGDIVRIELQVRLQGVRIEFEYKMYRQLSNKDSGQELCSVAKTLHVALGENLRPRRPLQEMTEILEREQWNETWLLSL